MFLSLLAVATAAPVAEAAFTTLFRYPATLSGVPITEHQFNTGVRNVKCEKATFAGSLSETSATVTITPTYSNCVSVPGALPATVAFNGCDYNLQHLVFGGFETPAISIACPAGKQIEIKMWSSSSNHTENKPTMCRLTIGAQGGFGGISYWNEGSGTSEKLKASLNFEPAVKTEGTPLLCGIATKMAFVGQVLFSGSYAGGPEGVMVG